MSSSSRILIVTPTLGNRNTLVETCKSVKEIGGENVHHVITCPARAINAVSVMVPGVEIIEEGGSRGVYGAVNHALKGRASRYGWVGYINDDDYWLPEMRRVIDWATSHPSDHIVYGRVLYVNQDNQPLMVGSCTGRYRSFGILAANGIIMFNQQAALVQSELYLRLGGFDESYDLVADTDFWIRAIEGGARCRFIDRVSAGYRLQKGQLSGDVNKTKTEMQKVLARQGISGNNWWGKFEVARYRLVNSKLYLSRLFRSRGSAYRVGAYIGRG